MVEHQEEGHAFGVQRPVYFISKVLFESKVHYPIIQKLLYGILITSRKLRHYFNAYDISVVTDFPLAISSIIGMPPGTSPSGLWNGGLSPSTSSPGQPSSHR
jgi:hypothetical protein